MKRGERCPGAEGWNPPPALYHRKRVHEMANLEEIRLHISDELQPSRKEHGKYICPLCGSGSHGGSSTAAFSIDKDGIHGHCFSCGFHGDIFDLVAQRDGISTGEATRALIDRYQPGEAQKRASGSPSYRPEKADQTAAQGAEAGPGRDVAQEIRRYHAALKGSEGERYLMGRGLTYDTMERFSLGYDAQRRRVTIPYNKQGSYYDTRAIDAGAAMAHGNLKGVKMPMFNPAALYSGGPCFIVESPLCAISIEQEGGRAAAISGTAGINRLRAQVEKKKPSEILILSLDNDEPGRKAQGEIMAMLEAQGIPFIEANISGDAKDPNELLQQGGGLLQQNIAAALRSVNEAREKLIQERREKRQQESAAGYINSFMDELKKSKAAPAISTGFGTLDRLLDGGLYPGLYIIGAITSLGKTTFTLQLCDQIAAAGHDVLFFSLEMARQELMAKSVSRLTYKLAQRKGLPQERAKTTRGILASKRWDKYSREEMELIAASIDEYRAQISSHIWIYEGVGNIGVEKIRQEVEKHISITGRLPVVAIDYLQILSPVDMRASDKQNTDKNVLELKRLSRDKGIPVFGISSLNRDNYTQPINNAAFKESGAIEYSSDVLIGLQFSGMDYQEGETDKARDKRIRDLFKAQKAKGNAGQAEELQLKILKNRNGRSNTDALFLYSPMFNHYAEGLEGFTAVDDSEDPFTAQGKKKRPL